MATVTVAQVKDFLSSLGIDNLNIREIHIDHSRVTVTRRVHLGATGHGPESQWKTETYPLVR